MKLITFAAVLALSGCATVETAADRARDFAIQHPIVTAVGATIIIGGIVVAVDHHHYDAAPMPNHLRVQSPCSPEGLTSCP